jgi:superfamily II DNA/RNA helicase
LIDGNPKQKGNNDNNKQQAQKQKSFEDLKLIRPLLKTVSEVGYVKPTPIQSLAIPVILSGKDVVASSITGSGKTAAFVLPILQRYFHAAAVGYIRALIVTPTRELAIQIHEEF